jgi:hypothetical protein
MQRSRSPSIGLLATGGLALPAMWIGAGGAYMRLIAFAIPGVAFSVSSAHADMSSEELAKLAQNPVGNLISLPFQNNSNLNYRPLKKTQNILNIQPVIPIQADPEWNIITRTIGPVISQPALFSGDDRVNRS